MHDDRRWLILLLFACAAAGCGSELGSLIANYGDATALIEEDVLFSEDDDPAVGSLSFNRDTLLVQPYPGADAEELLELYAEVGAVVVDELAQVDVTVLHVAPQSFDATAMALAQSGLIETVQKDYLFVPSLIPSDPLYDRQPHLDQIRADLAWDITTGSEEIVIGIVDTGVNPDHPDLADKILDGWNVVDGNSNFDDVFGHGTLVAGVAAAISDNQVGVTGMAWGCPLLAVRVSDTDGTSSARHIAAGILWAVDHGASVVNVSFAPLWSNRVVRAAARQAFNRGALVVISAGNDGGTTSSRGYREALFVSAVGSSGQIARFSDGGPFVDVAAPGVGIRSTSWDGGYDVTSGTSFAAPIVAGTVALAWSANPDLRPISIAEAILNTTADAGASGDDDSYGTGILDPAAAIAEALDASNATDSAPPVVAITQPKEGATLTGRTSARVTATDRWGVADVVMTIDGIAQATDTRAPYRFVIDPAKFSAGTHEVSFVATDASGNGSAATSVTVTFRPATPSRSDATTDIVFTAPRSGARVAGDVTIQATVSDSDSLVTVEWFVDGIPAFVSSASGESTEASFNWDTSGVSAGRHTITLIATDLKGDETTGTLILNTR